MDPKKVLSEEELSIVLECLRCIHKSDFIGEYEFYARLGVERDEFEKILAAWPSPSGVHDSRCCAAVKNALNEVSYGITFGSGEWEKYFQRSRKDVQEISERVRKQLR